MRVVCVDGNENDLANTVALCREHPAIDEVVGYTSAAEALARHTMNRVELVLLATDLPDGSGIELAAELRKNYPLLTIIFLSENANLAYEAYSVYPQNYLLKPLSRDVLAKEVNYYLLSRSLRDVSHIEVKTFGNFEILVDGSAVNFKRSKSKELLALLIDREGAGIRREQAYNEMWEDGVYDRKAQKYFDVILHSLSETLSAYGINEILEVRGGFMRIRPELINCDKYRFMAGDSSAGEAYRGVYMYGYSWANWSGDFFNWAR